MDVTRLLLFVETRFFSTRWQKLGLTDADLSQLQWSIMEQPLSGAVMSGAGGYRKARFAPKGMGKSGAFRVIFVPNLRYRAVMFTLVYGKNEIANVNAAGKKALAKQAAEFESILKTSFEGR